jgi:uncharacterized cupredoxin-like copper-binding protein
MKTRLRVLSTTLLALFSVALVHAHGDEHNGKNTNSQVRKEQTEWGIVGDAKAVRRVIVLAMSDNMRFTPDKIEVKQGETIKLVVKNDGRQLHELVIGTRKVLDEHAALMVRFPNMQHDEPYMAHVPPGKSGEVIWNFNRAGEFDFACLIAGHFQAGMTGKINVLKGDRNANK